jgi:hypothetical protein
MVLATPRDACCEQARNEGRDHPERAWILTFFDTWEPNPFYIGPPVRHPETDYDPADEFDPRDSDATGPMC